MDWIWIFSFGIGGKIKIVTLKGKDTYSVYSYTYMRRRYKKNIKKTW